MAKEKFHLRLSHVYEHVVDPSKTPTTLSASVAKGATSISVASATGITNGATILVGSGETAEWNKVSGSPSGSTVTLAWATGRAHAAGEKVVPGITYDFGAPTEEGVEVSIDIDSSDVNLSTRRTVLTQLRGYMSARFSWASPYFTFPVLASALGIKQSRITGSGTSSEPYQLALNGETFGEDIDRGVLAVGKLADGSDFFVELHGVDKDYTQFRATLRRGQLASIPHAAQMASQIVFGTSVPSYTVDTSLRPTKAYVFNAPSEFGIYEESSTHLDSVLAAAISAGDTELEVDDASNGSAGDRLLVGVDEDAEILIVGSIVDATITTRNEASVNHPAGTPVVEQKQTPFGGVTDEGLELTIGGTTKEIAFATAGVKGLLPATATMSMSFMVGDLSLANIARALAVPQSDISSNRLAINSNIATSDIAAAYFRGITQGGKTLEIDATGVTQDIRNFALRLSGKDIAKVPLTLRPPTLVLRMY